MTSFTNFLLTNMNNFFGDSSSPFIQMSSKQNAFVNQLKFAESDEYEKNSQEVSDI